MEVYDSTYLGSRQDQMYGVSSALVPPSHSLFPSSVHDPLSSQSRVVSAEYQSGMWAPQSSYQAASYQSSALSVGISPAWAASTAQNSVVASSALPINNAGVWESPRTVIANTTSDSLAAASSGVSVYITPPASQIALTEVASPSWMAPNAQVSLAAPQDWQGNHYRAGTVESPCATVHVAKVDPLGVLSSDHAFLSKPLSQQALEWSIKPQYVREVLLVSNKPPLSVVITEPVNSLYVTHVVSDDWRFLVDNVKEVAAVIIGGVLWLLWSHLEAIQEAQRNSAKFNLLERLTCKIKALHKPLEIIPQSLRPVESATL